MQFLSESSVSKPNALQAEQVFKNLTGLRVKTLSHPGLEYRDTSGNKSILVTTENDDQFILTFRYDARHAELEAEVLHRLSAEKAPVPKLINKKDNWLVQEYIIGTRLSQALDKSDINQTKILLTSSILSLARIQTIAKKIGLAKMVKPICTDINWREEMFNSLQSLNDLTKIQHPQLDKEAMFNALDIRPHSFIKWDARPGNSILRNGRDIVWFDWEHSGKRAEIDDLMWFLCDEWIDIDDRFEEKVIADNIMLFSEKELPVSRERYLSIFGTLHMCRKLLKILEYRDKFGWLDRDHCLKFEQMGVTRRETQSLITKATRWSQRDKTTKPLGNWLKNLDVWLQQLECK